MNAEHLFIDTLLREHLEHPEQWRRDRTVPSRAAGRSARRSATGRVRRWSREAGGRR